MDGPVFRRPALVAKAVAEIDRHSRDLGYLLDADGSRFRKREGFDSPMLVFAAEGEDTIIRAVSGEKIGTLITAA